MTRVVIAADSGHVLADLTAAVAAVPGAYIVRHASSRAPLDRLLPPIAPDLVLIGDLPCPSEALARLAEVRRAAPGAKVVVVSSGSVASWLANALRSHAAAVVPGCVDPATVAIELREAIAANAPPAAIELARARARRTGMRARRRRSRRVPVELPHEDTAA